MRTGVKGFTLIELLVVIAIIAILAAILFPVFAAAKRHASESKCLANLKQVGVAVSLYLADSNDRYPLVASYSAGATTPDDVGTGGISVAGLILATYKYSKSTDIWMCPVGARRKATLAKCNYPYGQRADLVGYVKLPSGQLVCSNYWCYALNREFYSQPASGNESKYYMVSSGNYILIGDENARGISPGLATRLHGRTFSPGGLYYSYYPNPSWNNRLIQDSYVPGDGEWRPHRNGTTTLYHDGHAALARDYRREGNH